MKDLWTELAATARTVARRTDGGDEFISVDLPREYPADVVWDAITTP